MFLYILGASVNLPLHVCLYVQEEDEDDEPEELLLKPKEYKVKFSFPNPPPLKPPILGLYGMGMGWEAAEMGLG